jgi:hypothetical protein
MPDQRERERAKIDGRAAFAGAAYLMGIGLIFLLARVGAPDGLVRGLGPLFDLAGLVLVGLLTRSTRAPAFFVADRAVPAPYAGLALAAIAAGLVIALDPLRGSPLPLAGVAIGLAFGGVVIGPALRAINASAPSDALATRFPHFLLRLYFAGLLFAIGALVAIAGFATAVEAFMALFAPSRAAAVTIVAIILALMVVPGGLAGLLWNGAAAAGMLIVILGLPIAAPFFSSDATFTPALWDPGLWSDALARAWGSAAAGDPKAHYLIVLASALAVATLPPVTSPGVGAFSGRRALRAGALGLVFAILLVLIGFVDFVMRPSGAGAMNGGLESSAVLVAALMLAAAGVHSASRAWGASATRAFERYTPLASQRLARSRLLILIGVAVCAFATLRMAIDPRLALVIAAALSLGLVAPCLALALSTQANSAHGGAAVLVSLATLGALGAIDGRIPDVERLFTCALCAAAAGFLVGWATTIFSPGHAESTPVRRDLFLDAPLDAGG